MDSIDMDSIDMAPLAKITKACIQLIGISGKAGSGKDVVASYLRNSYQDTYIYPFASQLKLASSILFGIPIEHFQERALKETINPTWGVSPREMAQFIGTEVARDTFPQLLGELGNNFWIKRLNDHINGKLLYFSDDLKQTIDISPGDTIVVPDVRFQNEYDWIIANGGIVIQLERAGADGKVGIVGHISEAGYTNISNERTFRCENNGTLEELYRKIDIIMKTTEPSAENMEL